jgi:hypothetical protein
MGAADYYYPYPYYRHRDTTIAISTTWLRGLPLHVIVRVHNKHARAVQRFASTYRYYY